MTASDHCLHCHRPRGCGGSRGLCARCYKSPEIKSQYPPKFVKTLECETEEELEAIIAEQMQNLPPWWDEASERQTYGDGMGTPYAKKGRGA